MTICPPKSEQELLTRAYELAGLTLGELAKMHDLVVPERQLHAKGWVGELLELQLGATAQSKPEPDFMELGVELKTLPINQEGKPRESTFVCSIALNEIQHSTWETSTVWRKLRRILWIPIEASPAISLMERRIYMPLLWSPNQEQIVILKNDWQELTDMICFGQLSQITAKLGRYLQIRPKAAHAKSLRWGSNEAGEPTLTLPRGFYLRAQFTQQILEQFYF